MNKKYLIKSNNSIAIIELKQNKIIVHSEPIKVFFDCGLAADVAKVYKLNVQQDLSLKTSFQKTLTNRVKTKLFLEALDSVFMATKSYKEVLCID